MQIVADNDLLLKAASYGLLQVLVVEYVGIEKRVGFLGAAPYMLPKRLLKSGLRRDASAAVEELKAWFETSEPVEPDDDELAVAAELERSAQRLGVPLHEGESQLCAVLIRRRLELLLTGDKAAIRAFHSLIAEEGNLAELSGKVRCLEVIVQAAVARHGIGAIRAAICGEVGVDKSLSIIFSCSSPEVADDSILAGLESYISDLKRNAERVFAGT